MACKKFLQLKNERTRWIRVNGISDLQLKQFETICDSSSRRGGLRENVYCISPPLTQCSVDDTWSRLIGEVGYAKTFTAFRRH